MRTARLWAAGAGSLCLLTVALARPLLQSGTASGVAGLVLLVIISLFILKIAADLSVDLGLFFELQTRRKFRMVCVEKGLTSKDAKGRVVVPRLTQLIGGLGIIAGTIRPLLGQSLADWERSGPAFAMAFAVPGVRFRDNGDGSIAIQAGYRPLESVDVASSDDVLTLQDGVEWREVLTSVAVAVTEGGATFRLPLLDTHILVVGMTGAGKGSVLWSLILGLVPAARAGVVRFWGIDPKRLELACGRGVFGSRYASTEVDVVELLESAVRDMNARADQLAGRTRKFEPSPAFPVNVIILDELGYLSALISDRALSKRADQAIRTLLVLGRALGFVVVGAIQDPRKDNIDYRDLFPTKVAMKLEKPMVDLVLGSGAHDDGALCDLIPFGRVGAGVAFVKQEGGGLPLCVRFGWCSDELIQKTAATLGPGVLQKPRLVS